MFELCHVCAVPGRNYRIVQRPDLCQAKPVFTSVRIRELRRMLIRHQIIIFRGNTVNNQCRTKLKRIDNFFSVNLCFVHFLQFRAAGQDMEIPIFINHQHIQPLIDCITEYCSLPQNVF